MPPPSPLFLFPAQDLCAMYLCKMPQLLPSLRPHAPDVARQSDHLASTGENEQGENICYRSQRKQKGHIIAPQSLTCGQKKVPWFRVSGSDQRPGSEEWSKGQEMSTCPHLHTCLVKRITKNSAALQKGDQGMEQ